MIIDPIEKQFADFLDLYMIKYTRPEKDKNDPGTMDFYLPDMELYVEVKAYNTPRLHAQIERIPGKNVMILIGRESVKAFERLIEATI